MKTILNLRIARLLSIAALLISPPASRSQTPSGTIVDIAAGNSDFSTLVAAVQAAGLVETLSGPGPFTVFAPNNAAFAKLPAGTVEALLQDTNRLRQILLYHVVPGRVRSTDLSAGKVVTTQGAAVTVNLTNGVKVNDSAVIAADIEASNGVIHVIDTVLLPPPNIVEIAAGNSDFSTLVAAVQAAGLVETLSERGPFTVFAPNNAAFAKLPAGTLEALLQDTNRLRKILLYHVVAGSARSTDLSGEKLITVQGAAANVTLTNGVKVNGSTVIAADIEASNGVIHVIDTVLLPPPNIVEIAAGNPDFSTLVAAVQAAGLVEALTADGPYTVFAPNNAAFAKLPAGTVEALLQDTNRLRHILLYHVNHGPRLRSTDLRSGAISTMHGGLAKVEVGATVK
ncbi:MAG TPA: fasciclin domain-containing protein, partial [Verrucomicrobiae bacterium]